jgi:hypothetical protein
MLNFEHRPVYPLQKLKTLIKSAFRRFIKIILEINFIKLRGKIEPLAERGLKA